MRAIFLILAAMTLGCGDAESCETEGEHRCAEDMLEVCSDGAWAEEEDCAADGLICHAEGGHCMEDTMDME